MSESPMTDEIDVLATTDRQRIVAHRLAGHYGQHFDRPALHVKAAESVLLALDEDDDEWEVHGEPSVPQQIRLRAADLLLQHMGYAHNELDSFLDDVLVLAGVIETGRRD